MDDRRAAVKRLCKTLTDAGHRALLAGGCVRDLILAVEPKDYDIATSARPAEVARLFSKCVEVGAEFGVQIVVVPEGQIEVATFRKDGPYRDGRHPEYVAFVDEIEDAQRRDFTINAMFLDPATDEIIDYVGGQEDIRRKVLRTVGTPRARFSEDHLRLLRAIRFAARLGYEIESETIDAIREMAESILTTSPERIRDELGKMLTEGAARRAFELMDATKLLGHILPEVAAMKGVEQPPEFHPEGDVFVHTMLLLDHLKTESPALGFAALLHDVGKPLTQTFEDRIRFNNHDKVGARMSEAICRRLRMSNEDIEHIAWIVENHMRLAAAPNMRESKLKRFVREKYYSDLLEVCRLDVMASYGRVEDLEWIGNYVRDLPPEELKPAPLINGNDLIAMGYHPGPLFSEILAAVEDGQLEGQLGGAEEAKQFVMERWPIADLTQRHEDTKGG